MRIGRQAGLVSVADLPLMTKFDFNGSGADFVNTLRSEV
jgi:hypothetical protein